MDQPWHLELFGWLRIVQGERVIARFRSRKAEALLAYLAYFCHRSHPRQQLVELLWPEGNPSAGPRKLSVELTSLRRQLEPPGVGAGTVLLTTRTTVQLNPVACVTDVARFDAALEAAKRATIPADRAEQLTAAARLYRGELLPGSFEEWALQERQRLAEAFRRALHELVGLMEESGDLSGALQWARRAVAADPLEEDNHQRLIRLLITTGQIDAARDHYEQTEHRLLQELGLGLSSDIRDLIREAAPVKDRLSPTPADRSNRVAQRRDAEAPASRVRSATRPDSNLPLRFTRFFGREEERVRLRELLGIRSGEARNADHAFIVSASGPAGSALRPAARLVTMTGPGGTGKTRLALQVTEELRACFPGGVWFVSLRDLTEPALIPDLILLAFRLPRDPQQEALEQVTAFLSQAPSLLLLDNFEHLVEEGAEVTERLLQQVEHLTVLVTSRRRLGLEGERELAVAPLPIPGEGVGGRLKAAGSGKDNPLAPSSLQPPPFTLMEFSSVALFVDRAQAVRPDFQVTDHNAAAVARLCQRLEGLPLALELAAARSGVLTPQQMLERLDQRFELLVGRQRSADPRHRSLRATLDWSYQLLSPELQQFFARLAVFRGGCTVTAAGVICGEPHALEYLDQLREASLVQGVETTAGDAEHREVVIRFHILESLREYGAEQLAEAERVKLAAQHARYFLTLAEAAAPELARANQNL